ncbi:MAG: hypothetical protein WAK90_20745 [Pseudolabrys sp.]
MAVAVMAGVATLVVGAISVVAVTSVAEGILVPRVSAALEWVCLGLVPLTSVAVISAACRAETSLTLTPRTFTD